MIRITGRIVVHLGVFLLWNVAVGLALFLLAPPVGLFVALALAWALLTGYVLRSGRRGEARRWATLRLRPLDGGVLRWTIVAIPVLIVLSWALGELYVGIVPVPPETFNPFAPFIDTSYGRLSIALLAVAIAPVLEEFFFRGLIQRPLERRWGPAPAIGIAAGIFALVHFLPWVLPLHFFLGLVFGWVVYAARSIWAGVILHAANNAAAVLGMSGAEDQPIAPTLWQGGPSAGWWVALGLLALTVPVAFWVARKIRDAARTARPTVPLWS